MSANDLHGPWCACLTCGQLSASRMGHGKTNAPASDVVNHPPHYKSGGLECIDVIEAFGLGFHLGNAVKYLLRAGKKGDRLEDLKKARWYVDREISRLTTPATETK